MMDVQQVIALAIVAGAAFLLVRRYVSGRRKPKFKECADCAAATMHAPGDSLTRPPAHSHTIDAPAKQGAAPIPRSGAPPGKTPSG